MELQKRPQMLEVAQCLRKLREALHQGRERLALFSWGSKNKLAPAEAAPSQESSSSSHSVGIADPTKIIFPLFNLDDLLRASCENLGKGTVGATYKATLFEAAGYSHSGYPLVIKRVRGMDLPEEQFDQRVAVIGAIQNKHIARLKWYFWGEDQKLLLYNFFPMGSLAHALHGDAAPLGWEQRAAIALAAARGVAYIHSAGPLSFHGNIKSSNVMLTGTRDAACVSEHGLAVLCPFPGASGYSAPEISYYNRASQEADVYSFGVLLLELLTRKAPVKNTLLGDGVNSVSQHEWAAKVIYVQLLGQQHKAGEEECMVQLLQLAIHCCSEDASSRTTMSDVVRQIEKMQTSQESSSSTRNMGTFIVGSTTTCPFFVLKDLLQASAEGLGKGTLGTTFKGTLESGYPLVIKRLRVVDLPKQEFDMRVARIGAIQNKHIAPLQWYYCSNDDMLLVYNYFPMGSLAHVLPMGYRAPLAWDQRVAIALAAARGVACIHSAGPSSCHGNIKSSNILLTGTHDACVSEHGLTALGLFPGASGYTAPEITCKKWVSQKADVYSFGVVLLELFTRRVVNNTQLQDGVTLPQWVRSVARHKWAAKVIDVELLEQQQKNGDEECMVRLLQLAMHCCIKDVNSRPTMSDVVQRIEKMQT